MQLENKVALITGIDNDIGYTTAIAMAKAGAKVAIADRDVDRGEAIAAKIKQDGGEAFFQEVDITLDRYVIESIDVIVDRYGSIDVAFNNACMEGDYYPIAQQPESLVASLIDFNFNGTWICIKHEIRQMLKQNCGAIVNNVGKYKTDGSPGCAIYRANKAAIEAITQTAAVEYGRYNIRVNAISPGILQRFTMLAPRVNRDGEEIDASGMRVKKPSSEIVPMGRVCQFQEVADTVVWLCSDESSFITGHTLPIDGGLKALTTQ